ncbi:hypothetical protein SeLEV6574_g07660 [Synchytrium endobioticum]|uniref:Uncharacterized protein n=1 Tax=Synchytrium endobioticum TaxID=286115 RepID=A0A507CGV3_9FUNG|nr:hypothetical protein SeLEV6574_g07660 [Synchytrium endobioticum]
MKQALFFVLSFCAMVFGTPTYYKYENHGYKENGYNEYHPEHGYGRDHKGVYASGPQIIKSAAGAGGNIVQNVGGYKDDGYHGGYKNDGYHGGYKHDGYEHAPAYGPQIIRSTAGAGGNIIQKGSGYKDDGHYGGHKNDGYYGDYKHGHNDGYGYKDGKYAKGHEHSAYGAVIAHSAAGHGGNIYQSGTGKIIDSTAGNGGDIVQKV